MPYIYSTLTCDQAYTAWTKNGDQQSIQRQVIVKGGAGLMNQNFITPKGTVTEVSEEELTFLQSVDAFKLHLKNGHLTVEKRSGDADKVAANLSKDMGSAPATPADFEAGGRSDGSTKAPTVTGGGA